MFSNWRAPIFIYTFGPGLIFLFWGVVVFFVRPRIHPAPETTIVFLDSSYLAFLAGLIVSFIWGVLVSRFAKHGVAVHIIPLTCLFCAGLLALALLFAINHLHTFDTTREIEYLKKAGIMDVFKYLIVGLILLGVIVPILFSRHIRRLFPSISKIQLPGGMTFGFDKQQIEKQDQIVISGTEWRRSIGNFKILMERLGSLIDETPPYETIKFLAYTPAIGFLARPKSEWNELYVRLLRNPNIQFTCLRSDLLKKWHRLFIGEKTAGAPDGITLSLADMASSVSEGLLGDRNHDNERVKPIEKEWNELPGLYLFSNKTRAIVVTPFVPQLGRENTQKKVKSEDEVPTAEMFGFETIDPMTVMIVRQLCERYRTQGRSNTPLAERFGPHGFSDFVGHESIRFKNSPIKKAVENRALTSCLFWGPSGGGKAVLAEIIGREMENTVFEVFTGEKQEFIHYVNRAKHLKATRNLKTIVFEREINRFNKAEQREIFYEPIKRKEIILIAAMDVTCKGQEAQEEIRKHLHSDLCDKFEWVEIKGLDYMMMKDLIYRALYDPDTGLGQYDISLEDHCREELTKLISRSKGNARVVLNELERVVREAARTGNKVGNILEGINRSP